MAHYASDCWDAEILMSSGWIECVGHADRACFDLEVHSRRSGVDMVASKRLATPRTVESFVMSLNKPLLGSTFKASGNAKAVMGALEAVGADEARALALQVRAARRARCAFSYPPHVRGPPMQVCASESPPPPPPPYASHANPGVAL